MTVPWLAREAGIFKKHGLEVEVIATPSGVEGMNALIAGEISFLQIAGATTASAAVGGADVVVIGTTINTLVLNFMVRPEIEKAEQLRGKSIGISRFGTTIDTGARIALRHFGLVPEKDVSIIQLGGMESIVPAMTANRVQSGILSYPATARGKQLGFRELLDIASLFAITQAQLRSKLAELSHLASRDFLTGLPNGHAFYELAAKEMDRAFGMEPMTLVCIDITGFKWINHRFGYPAGDQLMCSIAHTIRQNVPRPDLVGRLGGTSYGVLLPGIGSDLAHLILQRVQTALDYERRKNAHPLTFFISAVACTRAPRTVAELMQQADAQMTRIKNGKADSLQIARVDHLPALN